MNMTIGRVHDATKHQIPTSDLCSCHISYIKRIKFNHPSIVSVLL